MVGNNCGDNWDDGIEIGGSANCVLQNQVSDNGGNGILCNPATGNYLASNSGGGNSGLDFNIGLLNVVGGSIDAALTNVSF